MWAADSYLENLYHASWRRIQLKADSSDVAMRKEDLKQKLQRLLGDFETVADGEHQPRMLERVQCEGYIRERVELSAVPGLSFGAYVLIPEGGRRPLPAVVAIHGHGYGSREIVGLQADGSPSDPDKTGIHGQFAVELVKRGVMVIAPDIAGFGERRLASDLAKDPHAPNSCYSMATQLLMYGKTLTGLRVAEIRRAVEYTVSRTDADERRIGMMGFSGGGLLAYTCAVLEERIRAVVVAGYTNTFKDSIMAVRHCLCNFTPQMLQYAELPEWIGLLSPRPLFLESGADDPIFPQAGFEEAARQLRDIYKRGGAEHALHTDLFPGRHEISGRRSFDWLCQTLAE
ncbi:dienelactone hydrolase family protein [Paenibacillus sp. 7541]|uniref:dienelactone hydrolase family protein n=1 Tax=Paenibacillus sp. 7541 TaxID=2026236 RepID=UPI000BA5BCA5|nr:alpha/beta hydrolase family protein [Paenibacillus sp. 7541]PAK54426.1 dienelactone hydrolase [Paenibacillus sp. 7541]